MAKERYVVRSFAVILGFATALAVTGCVGGNRPIAEGNALAKHDPFLVEYLPAPDEKLFVRQASIKPGVWADWLNTDDGLLSISLISKASGALVLHLESRSDLTLLGYRWRDLTGDGKQELLVEYEWEAPPRAYGDSLAVYRVGREVSLAQCHTVRADVGAGLWPVAGRGGGFIARKVFDCVSGHIAMPQYGRPYIKHGQFTFDRGPEGSRLIVWRAQELDKLDLEGLGGASYADVPTGAVRWEWDENRRAFMMVENEP